MSTFSFAFLPWVLAGAVAGYWLVDLGRLVPRKVLQFADAPLHEWQGPGGGLDAPVSPYRRIWVPLLNASLWGVAAAAAGHGSLAALPVALMASTLLLLGLIDWDTTLLPDLIVLPLGAAGLAASALGLTGQSFAMGVLSAAVMLVLMGGIGWIYQRLRGVSGVGGGDLKLFAALAAWWGLDGVVAIVLCSSIITVAWQLIWRRFKGLGPDDEWPFGPSIAAAALVCWWGVGM